MLHTMKITVSCPSPLFDLKEDIKQFEGSYRRKIHEEFRVCLDERKENTDNYIFSFVLLERK